MRKSRHQGLPRQFTNPNRCRFGQFYGANEENCLEKFYDLVRLLLDCDDDFPRVLTSRRLTTPLDDGSGVIATQGSLQVDPKEFKSLWYFRT